MALIYSQNKTLKKHHASLFFKGSEKVLLKNDNVIAAIQLSKRSKINGVNFLDHLKNQLKLQANTSFKEGQTNSDKLGYQHIRYSQYFRGLKIDGAQFILHQKDGIVKRINGHLYRNINLVNKKTISSESASESAIQDFQKKQNLHTSSIAALDNGKLLIIEIKNQFYQAYKINVINSKDNQAYIYYIDAESSKVLKILSLYHNNGNGGSKQKKYQTAGSSHYNGIVNIDISNYSRVSHHVQGEPVYSIYSHLHDPTRGQSGKSFSYKIPNGPNGINTQYWFNTQGLIVVKENALAYDIEVGIPNKTQTDYTNSQYRSGVSALWALQKTYDYYKSIGYTGYDNNNSSISHNC